MALDEQQNESLCERQYFEMIYVRVVYSETFPKRPIGIIDRIFNCQKYHGEIGTAKIHLLSYPLRIAKGNVVTVESCWRN